MVATSRFCSDKNAFDPDHDGISTLKSATVLQDIFHVRSLDSAVLKSELSLSTVIISESRIGRGSGHLAGLLYLHANAQYAVL